ncbi:hypothetical protein EV193_11360 [Herbihabitans rhizosphaerae]|uniref:Uncharacterized protein n=1 Tax=Herbihabitans rhizosphaerae TaxID=1872711 RepID=A0A4Q7KG65_9PSEU|nr:hypothetical protein [Herbihabitans rhizosphaerae]RZS32217.1 hypothetical protein EV193_11360 [Herbihabitans rhizosphaerae]
MADDRARRGTALTRWCSRLLLVLGGAVITTVAAWMLSEVPASATPIVIQAPADPIKATAEHMKSTVDTAGDTAGQYAAATTKAVHDTVAPVAERAVATVERVVERTGVKRLVTGAAQKLDALRPATPPLPVSQLLPTPTVAEPPTLQPAPVPPAAVHPAPLPVGTPDDRPVQLSSAALTTDEQHEVEINARRIEPRQADPAENEPGSPQRRGEPSTLPNPHAPAPHNGNTGGTDHSQFAIATPPAVASAPAKAGWARTGTPTRLTRTNVRPGVTPD